MNKMNVEAERVKTIYHQIMDRLEKDNPNLALTVSKGGYLVTRTKVSVKRRVKTEDGVKEIHSRGLATIIDFTSQQKDHLEDFKEYTTKLCNDFYPKERKGLIESIN